MQPSLEVFEYRTRSVRTHKDHLRHSFCKCNFPCTLWLKSFWERKASNFEIPRQVVCSCYLLCVQQRRRHLNIRKSKKKNTQNQSELSMGVLKKTLTGAEWSTISHLVPRKTLGRCFDVKDPGSSFKAGSSIRE